MHRFWSLPIFFLAMFLVFWTTINIGGAFIDFFDLFFGAVFVDGFRVVLEFFGMPPWIITVLAGGLGAGIQTVSTFIPIIFTMFFALSILEDSSYMARAAFIMDRFMRIIGLPGKSFVPMLVGFGCTVPAILGTRTLENSRDRYLTIFMTPFMSCGGSAPGLRLFRRCFLRNFGRSHGFFPLLGRHPPCRGYRIHLKTPSFHGRGLPLHHGTSTLSYPSIKTHSHPYLGSTQDLHHPRRQGNHSFGHDLRLPQLLRHRRKIRKRKHGEILLAKIGKAVTPLFGPLGIEEDNWPATVALFSGIFAKEAVVGTLTSLYSQNSGRTTSVTSFNLGIASLRLSYPYPKAWERSLLPSFIPSVSVTVEEEQ